MAQSYIPAKQGNFAAFAANFNTLIAENPAYYGISSVDAAALTTNYNAFNAAYAVATAPSTKTKDTVAAKNAAQANLTAMIRNMAMTIQASAGISNDDKAALGLTIRKATPTPVPVPTSNPILGWIGGTPGQATLSIADSNTPTKKAKPPLVQSCQLFLQVAGTVPVNVDTMQLAGTFTKATAVLSLPSGAAGKTCYLFGRWITRTGLVGPLSPLLTITGT